MGERLTRREFIGTSAAVLGATLFPEYVNAIPKEKAAVQETTVWYNSDRLYNVSVYVLPIGDSDHKVRIFEISHDVRGKSRFTEVDKNTGREFIECSMFSGSSANSHHQRIRSELVRRAWYDLHYEQAGMI